MSTTNKHSSSPSRKKPKFEHSSPVEEASETIKQPSKSTAASTKEPQAKTMSDTEIDLFPASASNTNNAATAATSGNTINGPQTPPHNSLNAAAPGELSPPRSQHASSTGNAAGGAATNGTTSMNALQSNAPAFMSNGLSTSFHNSESFSGGIGGGNNGGAGDLMGSYGAAGGYGPQQQEGGTNDGPGAWKSKKAQDEMQRAWEMVADKDWSAREFGDVILRGKEQRAGT